MADTKSHPDPAVVQSEETKDGQSVGNVTGTGDNEKIKRAQNKAMSVIPGDVKTAASTVDELLQRITKLVKSTAGLNSGLGSIQYTLWALAYIHANSPSRPALIAYISRLIGRTPSKVPQGVLKGQPAVSHLNIIASFLSDTRTTLRLVGLFPLYVLLKTLLSKDRSKIADPTMHRIALVQCLGYIGFQVIENINHLTNKGIIPPTIVAKRGGTAKWVAWSCRCWLVGVVAEFFRLAREAKLAQERKDRGEKLSIQEQETVDRKWWNELQIATSWLPVAVHFSMEGGMPGMNMGLVGFSGGIAQWTNFANLWATTKN